MENLEIFGKEGGLFRSTMEEEEEEEKKKWKGKGLKG